MKFARYFCVLFFASLTVGCLESSRAAPEQLAQIHQDKVVMYSTSWCGYCSKMRTFFKRNHIDYVEYDIEKSIEARKEYDSTGARGIPVVMLKGRVVEGYAPNAVLELIRGNPEPDS